MSTTTATAEVIGRPDQQPAHPRLEAVPALAAASRRPGHRLVDAAVLTAILAFQAAWLGALGYLAWLLVV